MGPEDVVLFISYSGATRDMLETLRTAKASGAKIILLTHYEDSPGAAMADVVLRCGAQESPLDSGSIPIKVAVLYVGEVLLLRYMLDDPEHTNEPGPHQRGSGHQVDMNSKTGGIQLRLEPPVFSL